MTVFDDITGWREELLELQSGPAYKKMYPKKIRNPKYDPLVPKSVILNFVETLLTNEELRVAIQEAVTWQRSNTEESRIDPDNDPTFPHHAANTQYDFMNWYMLKSGYGPRAAAYLAAIRLARQIETGDINDKQSAEADAFLRKAAKIHIDFDR